MKINYFRKFNNSKSAGFTLVETLVAISIFTISTLGLMVFLGKSISDTGYAKKKETAAYLAQEGIEYVRNMRDTYVLYSPTVQAGWGAFNNKLIAASCQNASGCYFNDQSLDYSNTSMPITGITFTACGSTCTGMLYDSATDKYGYASGVSSGFVRKIRMTQINANETEVFSTVYWTQGSGTYNMTFSENLLKWVE